jgi:hypothetical protein
MSWGNGISVIVIFAMLVASLEIMGLRRKAKQREEMLENLLNANKSMSDRVDYFREQNERLSSSINDLGDEVAHLTAKNETQLTIILTQDDTIEQHEIDHQRLVENLGWDPTKEK